ncbi:MAG: hypothetical protein J0M26_00805 [Planctomycetes bacterium]|nr:hypothetical protein [Planctomycetota bacterium]
MRWTEAADIVFGQGINNRRSIGHRSRYQNARRRTFGASRLMLTKPELCRMIVGLVEINDAELLDQDTILSADVCTHADRIVVRIIRDIILRLYLEFDYVASPRFNAETDGKSSAFSAKLSKSYSNPVQRKECRRMYAVALANILDDNSVYDLTRTAEHDSLDRLRELLNGLRNPKIG